MKPSHGRGFHIPGDGTKKDLFHGSFCVPLSMVCPAKHDSDALGVQIDPSPVKLLGRVYRTTVV